MSLTITLLVLLSAALHPLWNLLIKKDADPGSAYIGLTLSMMLAGLFHGVLTGANFWLSSEQWILMIASVCGQMLYGVALVATLKRGDLSAYYPIIRASPVFIVSFSILFLNQSYSLILLAGIFLVLCGAAVLLYRRNVNLLADSKILTLAILAMCGTGIYSLADSRLMQQIEPSVLFFWVHFFCWPLLNVIHHFNGHPMPRLMGISRLFNQPLLHLQLAACVYGSYFLILTVYGMGGEVASVTTVRQASIPLSVILGGYFLNEGAILRRLIASLILSAGIIIVILYG